MGQRENGTVKWFRKAKGYGFVVPDAGGTDVFIHISAVERAGLDDLLPNTRISFERMADKRGVTALDINVLS